MNDESDPHLSEPSAYGILIGTVELFPMIDMNSEYEYLVDYTYYMTVTNVEGMQYCTCTGTRYLKRNKGMESPSVSPFRAVHAFQSELHGEGIYLMM